MYANFDFYSYHPIMYNIYFYLFFLRMFTHFLFLSIIIIKSHTLLNIILWEKFMVFKVNFFWWLDYRIISICWRKWVIVFLLSSLSAFSTQKSLLFCFSEYSSISFPVLRAFLFDGVTGKNFLWSYQLSN